MGQMGRIINVLGQVLSNYSMIPFDLFDSFDRSSLNKQGRTIELQERKSMEIANIIGFFQLIVERKE